MENHKQHIVVVVNDMMNDHIDDIMYESCNYVCRMIEYPSSLFGRRNSILENYKIKNEYMRIKSNKQMICRCILLLKNDDLSIHSIHGYLHRVEYVMIGCNYDSID